MGEWSLDQGENLIFLTGMIILVYGWIYIITFTVTGTELYNVLWVGYLLLVWGLSLTMAANEIIKARIEEKEEFIRILRRRL